jgi:hypothetical protein
MRRAHRPRVQPGPMTRPRPGCELTVGQRMSASERRAIKSRQQSLVPREELTPEGKRAVQ